MPYRAISRLKKELALQFPYLNRPSQCASRRLLLFARNDICAAINRTCKGMQATGVAGVATNKGAVALGVRIWGKYVR